MRSRLVLFVAVSFLSAVLCLSAEQVAPSTEVVARLVVTAVAQHGAAPPMIAQNDVMVYEGHDRDKIADWVPAQGDHAGLQLFLLIDDSSATSLGSQLQDIRKFILAQPASTGVGVAYMQNGTAQVLQDLTADHAAAAKALRLPTGSPGANSSPYFSVNDLIKKWPGTTDRREVLMLTDGVDRYWGSGLNDPYVESAIDAAQRGGILIFSIYTPREGAGEQSYWRNWWGQNYMSELSDRTGGQSYYIGFSGAPPSLVPFLDDVARRLAHQYWLAFFPKPQKKAGLQPVRVTTEVPKVELVSTDRAYVPASSKAPE
jgi:hypothetical protein